MRFTSIFPACYAGRWPHVHFEVYPNGTVTGDAGAGYTVALTARVDSRT